MSGRSPSPEPRPWSSRGHPERPYGWRSLSSGPDPLAMYRKSIRRHRRLLLIPIVLGVCMALWTVAGSPKQYRATVSLWVDTPPPATSSLIEQNLALMPPADAEQQVVQ